MLNIKTDIGQSLLTTEVFGNTWHANNSLGLVVPGRVTVDDLGQDGP